MEKLNRFIPLSLDQHFEKINGAIYFECEGTIRYNPERKGLKKNATCCIIEIDNEIIDYYRTMLNNYYGMELIKPSWDAHVSIIQGSIDVDSEEYKKYWFKYDNKKIKILYSGFPRYSGDTSAVGNGDNGWFWFLDVKSQDFYDIRDEFGLTTNFKPHLTIGKRK